MELTDAQWDRIKRHFPEEGAPASKPGRKPVPARQVLEGAIWILKTGAQWHMMPQCYPNYKTVHRRFQKWCESEVLRKILCDLANEAREKDSGVLEEAYIDASFVPAHGGGDGVGYGYKGKGTKILAIVDKQGLPTAVATASNEYHEVTLVQLTLQFSLVEASPQKLLGDKGYDSDELDEVLDKQGIEMIAPNKKNRKSNKKQDGRMLRRMRRRFTVERTFAWFKWCRRLATRWDYHMANFLGFIELASLRLYLNRI